MFVQSSCDLDSLVKLQVLSSAQLMQKMRLRSGNITAARVQTSTSQPLIQQSSLLCVDDIYRDKKPPVPMHRALSYAGLRDPVHRHGTQALEMRTLEKKGIMSYQKASCWSFLLYTKTLKISRLDLLQ